MKSLEPGTPLSDALASRVPRREAQGARIAIRGGANFTSAHIMVRGNSVNILDKNTSESYIYSLKTGKGRKL